MINFWKNDKLLEGFSNHFLNDINATLPFYPPLMYTFVRANGYKNILEIGIEQGYSTYYFAYAAKMNGGMYYGIDIDQNACNKVDAELTKAGLPHKIICADTKELKDFSDLGLEKIDFAFLDGEHTTEAVEHEVELIYPLLSNKGWGYIFIHDIIDMGNARAWWNLKNDKRFETLGLNPNYGLGIARKMEEVNYEENAKRFEQSIYFKRRWDVLRDLVNGNNYKIVAEIGVDKGETTKSLLGHCDIRKYVLVDTNFNQELKKELISQNRPVEILETSSLEAAKKFEDETFDLIFIDADHQYQSVKDDINAWLPKVRKGGMISGHDYFKSGDKPDSQVTSAVNELLGKVELISDESPNSDRCVWWKVIE